MIWYALDGINPEPWEAPEGSVARGKNGGFYVQMHKPHKVRSFQESVIEQFSLQNPFWVGSTDQLCEITFYLWRNMPSYESQTGRKAKANWADATNMQKALEDALQGILYDNDRQVIDVRTVIVEQGADIEPGIVIKFSLIEHSRGDGGELDAEEFLAAHRDRIEADKPEPVAHDPDVGSEFF